MPYLIANFVLFQASWVALVGGAGHGMWFPGAVMLAVFLAWELRRSADPWSLGSLACVAVVGGILVDGSYAISGVVAYRLPQGPIAPWWILGLWIAFALTLTESMGWMRERRLVASLLAGIAAPLSYLAGFKLGAVTFPRGLPVAMAVAAVTWIPAVYALITLGNRLLPARQQAR